ncbi:MAG: PAS domain S-box protein [Planctomycetes bacterium]|nr:PAS domain S-box protein [Planctomycetota bacterium]
MTTVPNQPSQLERLGGLIVELSNDAIVVIDEDHRVVVFNAGAERMYGYKAAELVGGPLDRLLPDGMGPRHRELVEGFAAGGVDSRPMGSRGPIQCRRANGEVFPASATILHFVEGGRRYFAAIIRDLSTSETAARMLRESEERWRAVVENSPVFVLLVDRHGRIRFLNRTNNKAKPESYSGVLIESRVQPEHMQELRKALADVFDDRCVAQLTLSALDEKGALRWYRVTIGPIRGNNEEAVWIATDVTKERMLEDQLRQSQKMEAVGRLAGGIAHDFNNLLTVINGYAELLTNSLVGNQLREHADQVLRTGRRAAALTQQLLAFSRHQVLQPRCIDLNGCVKESENLLMRLIGEDVLLRTSLSSDLRAVMADPSQIVQAVLNLAVNARDAMPDGGTLTIETGNTELDANYCAQHPGVIPGEYVMLAVTDIGSGMTPEEKKHLFEPFFTTKPVGKGTGLGLSTVHGIVRQSGGHIYVYSELGKGTCFKLYFPAASMRKTDPGRITVQLPQKKGGHERILLVEDDDDLRKLTGELLSAQGYQVEPMSSPAQALHFMKTTKEQPHLMLTDVVMPGMNGRALAEKLRESTPGLRVLFMSGYTDNEILNNGMLGEGMHFLQKPFTIQQLATKVREVLDGAA